MERIKVGLIGFGTVGSSLYRLIEQNGDLYAKKIGVEIEISKIGVKDLSKDRSTAPRHKFVEGFKGIVEDPDIPIIIELVGGIEGPYELVKSALRRGKHVITANKALLSLHGNELFALAREMGVKLKFEASVAGGIPIIKIIRESLMGNRIERIIGIVNGTSNYILTRMTEDHLDFREALKEAQELGFAERDPSLDIEGGDAAQKISLLASFAFGQWIDYREVLCEWITTITPKEIEYALSSGFVFKPIASAEFKEGKPAVAVFPALLPRAHPLALVRNEVNAIFIDSDFLGSSVYMGRGAGGNATASSVASDLGDLVQRIVLHARGDIARIETSKKSKLYPVLRMSYRYFLHFVTENRPGIWATVTGLLAENGINIESVHQKWEDRSKPSDLYVLVDPAEEGMARKAFREVTASPGISAESRLYRIIMQ